MHRSALIAAVCASLSVQTAVCQEAFQIANITIKMQAQRQRQLPDRRQDHKSKRFRGFRCACRLQHQRQAGQEIGVLRIYDCRCYPGKGS